MLVHSPGERPFAHAVRPVALQGLLLRLMGSWEVEVGGVLVAGWGIDIPGIPPPVGVRGCARPGEGLCDVTEGRVA